MRSMLFHRDYRRFTGGHLKVWDYYNHVRSSGLYRPEIMFSASSIWGESNPWLAERATVLSPDARPRPDAFFVAGTDWQALEPLLRTASDAPVINLLQGPAHARPEDPRFGFLGRRAIRLCVSEDLKAAVLATGKLRGTVQVIPNGMDRAALPAPLPEAEKDMDLLVVASKNPGMGSRLQRALKIPGLRAQFLSARVPRDEFHAAIRRTCVTLFLPRREEGFYLPALEAMALGTLVICPDCIGNRGFCHSGVNCLRPNYIFEELLASVEAALRLEPARRQDMLAEATRTVERHDLSVERAAFLAILSKLDEIWENA